MINISNYNAFHPLKIVSSAISLILYFFCNTNGICNRFEIDYPIKEEYTSQDFLAVEELLLDKLYKEYTEDFYNKDCNSSKNDIKNWFLLRINSGFNLQLIDPTTGGYQPPELLKIGKGGKNCIVTYVSHNPPYSNFVKKMPDFLRIVGFDGYFLYQIGGYPTPTGEEIKYAGVPYAFKVFMMLEAHKRGFSNVLWLDSSLVPLKNPIPLFNWIDKHGVFISGKKLRPNQHADWVMKTTRNSLIENIGIDVLSGIYMAKGGIFGLKMETPQAEKFISSFYKLVRIGDPFCSTLPEEWVYSALVSSIYEEKQLASPFIWPTDLISHNKKVKNTFFHWQQQRNRYARKTN